MARVYSYDVEWRKGWPAYRSVWFPKGKEPPKEWVEQVDSRLRRAQSLADVWVPWELRYGSPADLPRGHFFMSISLLGKYCIGMDEVARRVLEPLLGPYGEFLPFRSRDGRFYIFNCLYTVDPTNREVVKVERVGTSEVHDLYDWTDRKLPWAQRRATWIDPSKLPDDFVVFRLPGTDMLWPLTALYVSDAVVEAARSAGLRGAQFELLWPPEEEHRIVYSYEQPKTEPRRERGWRQRIRRKVLEVGWDAVILEAEAVRQGSPTLAYTEHQDMMWRALHEHHLSLWEVSPWSRLSWQLHGFYQELQCGGFSQVVFNLWREGIASAVERALEEIGARGHLKAFRAGVAVVEGLGEDRLREFLEGEYFGDEWKEVRDELNRVNELFDREDDVEPLEQIHARWLFEHPRRVVLEDWEIEGWLEDRARSLVGRRRYVREAEQQGQEPRFVRLCQLGAAKVGKELEMVLGSAKLTLEEAKLAGVRFLAGGQEYVVAMLPDGKARVFDAAGKRLLTRPFRVPEDTRLL